MPILGDNFTELFTPIIYHFFDLGRRTRPSLISTLYNVQTSSLAEEKHTGMGGIAPDAWDNYKDSGNVSEVDFNKGYSKTFTHEEFPIRFRLQKKDILNDQYGELQKVARRLGFSAAQKMEIDAASTFNNAFSGSFVGPDAVALCSSAHPASPDNTSSGGQQINTNTLALSAANVETVQEAMMVFTDDVGNPLNIMPTILLVPPALKNDAKRICQSLQSVDSGNLAINPLYQELTPVWWAYLTDANNWFCLDAIWMKESLIWYDREVFDLMVVDETTTYILWEGKLHYSYGFNDWRWVYGNNAA